MSVPNCRGRVARARCWSRGLLFACLVALASAPAPLCAQESGSGYDLVVLVMAGPGEAERVALSYTGAVESGDLRERIEQLGKAAGCAVSEIGIREVAARRGASALASDADFLAPGLVHGREGGLPVGPIIRSLGHWNRMRLVFVVGGEFRFSGPVEAEVDGYAVRLRARVTPYEYDVERRRGTPTPGGATATSGRPRRSLIAALAWAVAGVCGGAGLLAGWFGLGPRAGATRA